MRTRDEDNKTMREYSLRTILSFLGIRHYNQNNNQMSHSNPMQFKKRAEHMKMVSYIGKDTKRKHYLTLLRCVGGLYYVQFKPIKDTHNLQSVKFGGITA